MTDRIQSLHVTLEREIRTDDVQVIVHAIQMVKGVARVDLGEPIDGRDHLARSSLACEMRATMCRLVSEMFDGSAEWRQIKAILEAKWSKHS